MKKIIFVLFTLLLVTSCGTESNTTKSEINIVSTITPFSSIAQYIGDEKVSIHTLIEPGYSAHTFELQPSDIKKLSSSDLILSTGLELDNYIIEKIENKNILFLKENISLLEGHEHNHEEHKEHEEHEDHEDHEDHEEHEEHEDHEDHEEHEEHEEHEDHEEIYFDPHFWLSIENGKIIAESIKNELVKLDPENTQYYIDNYNAFVIQADEIINNYPQNNDIKDFIILHEAYNYFFKELNISESNILVLEETAGREPSVGEMANIIDQIKSKNIGYIFKEPQFESKLITTLQIEENLNVYVLDPLGNGVDKNGYFDNILANLSNLKNIYE